MLIPIFEGQLGDPRFIELAQAFRHHAIVLFLGRARERQVEAKAAPELERDPAILGRVRRGEKAGVVAISACLRHRFAARAKPRRFAEKPSRNIVRSSPSARAESKPLGEPGGVDVHHHVDERLHLCGFASIADVSAIDEPSAFKNRFGALEMRIFSFRHT